MGGRAEFRVRGKVRASCNREQVRVSADRSII